MQYSEENYFLFLFFQLLHLCVSENQTNFHFEVNLSEHGGLDFCAFFNLTYTLPNVFDGQEWRLDNKLVKKKKYLKKTQEVEEPLIETIS